jgi:hypothetical protein
MCGLNRLLKNSVLYQGTTLVVPKMAARLTALAAEVRFFSAVSKRLSARNHKKRTSGAKAHHSFKQLRHD